MTIPPGVNPNNNLGSEKLTRRNFLKLAGTAAVLGPIAAVCARYLPRATSTAPIPTTPEPETLLFLNSLVIALQNAQSLTTVEGKIFDPDEVIQILPNSQVVSDPVAIGQLLPPELDLALLFAIDTKLSNGPVSTLSEAKAKSTSAIAETMTGASVTMSLTSIANYYGASSIFNRWQSLTPQQFSEKPPDQGSSPQVSAAITKAQATLPIPEPFHTNTDQSYFDTEGISLSESQLQHKIIQAQSYLREKGASEVEIAEVEARMFAIAVWHEVTHGIDIIANPNLLQYLKKDDKLKAVCLTRIKAAQLDQIATHISEFLSLTGKDFF